MKVRLVEVGGCLYFRLPRTYARLRGLQKGSELEIQEGKDGTVVLTIGGGKQ